MPKTPNKKIVDSAIEELDKVRREWLRQPGVTAVDVGFKIKEKTVTDDVALRVHVARKKPVAELEASQVFNVTGKAPKKQGGFPIDVIQAQYAPSEQRSTPMALDDADEDAIAGIERLTVFDPLIGGVSCGNPRVTAGTIGVIVFDRRTCRPMILSNWHVLAGSASAAVGEGILQPGRVDGGTQVVANLTRMRLDSRMDAAVATLNSARGHSRDILGLGTITGMDTATLGMEVEKSGRTTGITRGLVDGVSMSVSINYTDPGVINFTNQIRIVPRPPWPAVDTEISMGGDSGSIWMNQRTNRAIGLHFAGETDPLPASENAICNPIQEVARELDFSFMPVLCPIQPPVRPPLIDFCDRFPEICELLRRRWPTIPPFPPIPRPGPDPLPFDLPRDDLRVLTQMLGGGGADQRGCSCGGHGGDDRLLQLVALLALYGRGN